MNSDPVADMLTRIRNGSRARLARVEVPHSKLKVSIAKLLKDEGFIDEVREVSGKTAGQGVIDLKLRYDDRKEPVITGIKRVSSPGLRNYMRCQDIPKVQSGLGVMILTTSQGVLTDRQCRDKGVGGEALCAIW